MTLTLVSPYTTKAHQYKGQLHCHSTNSDGDRAIATLVADYLALGFDFVVSTDHDFWPEAACTIPADPEVVDILFISGGEETSSLNPTWGHHWAGLGLTSHAATLWASRLADQELIDWIIAHGAIPIMAHPNFGVETLTHIQTYKRYVAMEIFNAKTQTLYNGGIVTTPDYGNAEAKWDYLLSLNDRPTVWGVAVDDFHSTVLDYGGPGTGSEVLGACWVKVNSDVLTQAALFESILAGNFYSSAGPELSIIISGVDITITTPDLSAIVFIGDGGVALQTTTHALSATWTVRGNEKYIRARVIRDSDATLAWTNPITYVDVDPSRGQSMPDNTHRVIGLDIRAMQKACEKMKPYKRADCPI